MNINDISSNMNTMKANTYSSLVKPLSMYHLGGETVPAVDGVSRLTKAVSLERTQENQGSEKKLTFQDYLLDAVKSVNQKQLDVSDLQEKIITNPDEVDIHDVTIAMSKAQLSLNMAQTVIDRLVQGWSEITTTR